MVRKVCIDPGIYEDWKITTGDGLSETMINYRAAELLEKELNDRGIKFYTTIKEGEEISNFDRVQRINASGADLLISLHCNRSFEDYCGLQVLYHSPKYRLLASEVYNRLSRDIYKKAANNGNIFYCDWQILRESKMPALLIKMGYVTHNQDRKLLTSKTYIPALMKELANIIQEVFDNGKSSA